MVTKVENAVVEALDEKEVVENEKDEAEENDKAEDEVLIQGGSVKAEDEVLVQSEKEVAEVTDGGTAHRSRWLGGDWCS